LFGASRPPTIRRLIVTVAIDAIYRVKRRRLVPHICKKGWEIVPPFLADGDSTASIKIKIFIVFIETARLYRLPTNILSSPGMSMSPSRFKFQTSARSNASIFQVIANYNFLVPAFTNTTPPAPTKKFNGEQFVKLLTTKISKFIPHASLQITNNSFAISQTISAECQVMTASELLRQPAPGGYNAPTAAHSPEKRGNECMKSGTSNGEGIPPASNYFCMVPDTICDCGKPVPGLSSPYGNLTLCVVGDSHGEDSRFSSLSACALAFCCWLFEAKN
jgi:hypothetical protein